MLGRRIEDAFPFATALAIVFFGVDHRALGPDMKSMDAIMLRSVTAIIVNAAAGDDLHISALADIKVIIDQIMDAAVGQDDRDMHLLPGRARRDDDVNARLIALLTDLDIGGGVALHAHAIGAQIERGGPA